VSDIESRRIVRGAACDERCFAPSFGWSPQSAGVPAGALALSPWGAVLEVGDPLSNGAVEESSLLR
jgi:hypothetical protein